MARESGGSEAARPSRAPDRCASGAGAQRCWRWGDGRRGCTAPPQEPDDLDLSLCLRDCAASVTVGDLLQRLPAFAASRPELGVAQVKLATILSNTAKDPWHVCVCRLAHVGQQADEVWKRGVERHHVAFEEERV